MLGIHGKLIIYHASFGSSGLWFSLPLLSLTVWRFASYRSSVHQSHISPLLPDIREQISVTVIVFQACLIAVDLAAHVMISVLFNSCSCNQLFLSFFFFLNGGLALDVIIDLMVCEVACWLSGSFLEQSGRALINRLKEESDRAWMRVLLSPALLVSVCFFWDSHISSDYSMFCLFSCLISSALVVGFFVAT